MCVCARACVCVCVRACVHACVCVCVCVHACMYDYKIPKLLLMHVLYIHMQADDLVPLNESSAELLDHGSRFVS